MKEIKLTLGKIAYVDDEDYERVNQFKWYAREDGRTFYAERNVTVNGKRKHQSMHQFIMGETIGKPHIDHEDGNGLNNCQLNLRPCTARENQMNSHPRRGCSSKYKGVSWNKQYKKWRAYIKVDGKLIHLGIFDSEKYAARVYDIAAMKYFGEFAKLNFPNAAIS